MRGLGELEEQAMERLWSTDDALTVRQVLDAINATADRPLAYTTVMTVLDNLHRKGWLHRRMVDRAYQYWPSRSREDRSAEVMAEALAASGNRPATWLAFLDQLDPKEAQELAQLMRKPGPARRRRGRQ